MIMTLVFMVNFSLSLCNRSEKLQYQNYSFMKSNHLIIYTKNLQMNDGSESKYNFILR